ncbi:class D sortase [Sutcliffiella cohnii]|uniref:class D sortase n=1 Tax=Sutcliffiella cohnii TaxID=33932 RepID=UPI002E1BB8FB|nr:class D sortase [Sutcliffiella cohnii]
MREAKVISMFFISMGAVLFLQSGIAFWEGIRSVEEGVIERTVPPPIEPTIEQTFMAGEKIGYLHIPAQQKKISIFEGTSEKELQKGIGHLPKSSFPGQVGNIVLSGHRDTVFIHIDEWSVGDELVIESNGEHYTYKIKKTRIVDKDDGTVLVPRPREELTITTCYPFQFIGSAPERYIVIAERIK